MWLFGLQIVFQALDPRKYYLTEYVYCALSLASKLSLGGLLYASVLTFASFEEALSNTPAYNAATEALAALQLLLNDTSAEAVGEAALSAPPLPPSPPLEPL